jgi:hypothetical protein
MKAASAGPLPQRQAVRTTAPERLHGHPLERTKALAATAEAVGTFVLVLAITSAAVAASLTAGCGCRKPVPPGRTLR